MGGRARLLPSGRLRRRGPSLGRADRLPLGRSLAWSGKPPGGERQFPPASTPGRSAQARSPATRKGARCRPPQTPVGPVPSPRRPDSRGRGKPGPAHARIAWPRAARFPPGARSARATTRSPGRSRPSHRPRNWPRWQTERSAKKTARGDVRELPGLATTSPRATPPLRARRGRTSPRRGRRTGYRSAWSGPSPRAPSARRRGRR